MPPTKKAPQPPVHKLVSDRCRAKPGRLALPESTDPRVLAAADRLLSGGTMETIWLFSERDETLKIAENSGIDLTLWEGERSPVKGARIRWALQECPEKAASGMGILHQACELLYEGVVDAVVAGSIAATRDVIRAAISGVGLAPGVRTVSGSFIMDGSNTYIFADCGVVIDPTIEQLCDIAWESVRTWQGVLNDRGDPVVAFLSFSTKGSASHPLQEKAAAAAALFRERYPEIPSDGEMQFDAAFDQEIGQRKAPGSPIPGRANIFIFPDLNAGNIAYKITQRLGGYDAYGPILQGLAKPFCDLSRGATVEDIVTVSQISLLRSRLPASRSWRR